MKSPKILHIVLRRIATSIPLSMKINFPLRKATENILGNATSKSTTTDSASKKLPRSFRALQKVEPKERSYKRNLNIGSIAILAIPLTTFGLGCWQVERRRQKHAQMSAIEKNATKEARPLPDDLRELLTMEFSPVVVVGEFCHDEELIVKPRHRHDQYRLAGTKTDPYGRMNEVGAHIITPFKLVDKPYKILIQRGWVPMSHVDPAKRAAGQVKGRVEIVGVVRNNEKKPKFVPENDPFENEWNYRDIDMMARLRNCAPVYLEANGDSTVSGGPIGGQTIMHLRNEHLSYIITWYTLAGITGYMWWRRYMRPVTR